MIQKLLKMLVVLLISFNTYAEQIAPVIEQTNKICEWSLPLSKQAEIIQDDIKDVSSPELIYTSLNTLNDTELKKVYQTLNIQQKITIWHYHLEQLKLENALNDEQIKLIDMLKDEVSFSLGNFSNNKWANENVIKPRLKLLKPLIQRVLGKDLAMRAVTSLKLHYNQHSDIPTFQDVNVGINMAPTRCTCSQSDDWCWGSCGNDGCRGVTSHGCGWWLAESCDGNC